jgi:hypothetical protein
VDLPYSRVVAVAVMVVALAVPLALAACGSDDPAANENASNQATHRDFDSDNFDTSTKIDNKFSPLVPGTQFVYEGRSNRGHGRLPHRVVFTVTDLTKVINGVRTVVMWDRDINAGKLLEAELAFHAQDNDGNVWNLGEYPEEREDGKVTGAPDTWLAGLDDANAGVLMRANPRVGTSSYRQGWVPSIEFGDLAKVYKTGQRNCVPLGCYDNVLVTDETNPFEAADGHQLKYYAPGVGNIRAAPRGGKEKEILVLIEVRRLGRKALAKVREESLKLDKRAYRVRKDVYARTPPAERRVTGGR